MYGKEKYTSWLRYGKVVNNKHGGSNFNKKDKLLVASGAPNSTTIAVVSSKQHMLKALAKVELNVHWVTLDREHLVNPCTKVSEPNL